MNIKISIIVPIYNAEQYLPCCIDSILDQTFTDFELLLINDGSTDSSGRICDEYTQKDNRIRVFHQKNGGAMSARALGVKHSRSNGYITFVDADDKLPIVALEILAKYCSDTYDIIIGRTDDKSFLTSELTKEENCSCAISETIVKSAPWGRLIKRNLFDDRIFDIPREIVVGEDMLMNIRLAFKNQKPVKLINEKVYIYSSDNKDSIMHTFKPTIEYEEMFSKYRLLSIPTEFRERYLNEIILSQVNGIIVIINDTRCECSKHPYVQAIIAKIKKNKIRLPLFHKLKLKAKSNLELKLIFFVENVKNKIKAFL